MRVFASARHRHAGFTVLESAVALGVGAVALLAIGQVLTSATGSTDYLVTESAARAEMQNALGQMQEELQASAPSLVNVTSDSEENSVVTFQTAGPWMGTTTWGAADSSGFWKEDWSARYRVVSSSLIRESIDGNGTIVGAPVVLVRDVDESSTGAEGFTVEQNGSIHTIHLGVRKTFSDGKDHEDSLSTAVHVKNNATP